MPRFYKLDYDKYRRPGYDSFCTVVALHLTCNFDFDEALKKAKKYGRTNKGGFAFWRFFPERRSKHGGYIQQKVNGCEMVNYEILPKSEPKVSIGDFLDNHKTGRYVICTSGHAMAVIDGCLYDFCEQRESKRLRRIYTIKAPKSYKLLMIQ